MTDQEDEHSDADRSDGSLEQHRPPAQVQSVYDEIASHFSKTRAYPWPEVRSFLDEFDGMDDGHQIGLDIGCGNGRHTAPLSRVVDHAIGIDLSGELLTEARAAMQARSSQNSLPDNSHDGVWRATLVQGHACRLPIATDAVAIGLYVATIHHLADRAARIESLRELRRVLDPEGLAQVSAWSTEHERFADREDGFDTTIDWTLPGGETVPRFYHIYVPTEFEADLNAAGLSVVSSEISSGNCYATVAPSERKHP